MTPRSFLVLMVIAVATGCGRGRTDLAATPEPTIMTEYQVVGEYLIDFRHNGRELSSGAATWLEFAVLRPRPVIGEKGVLTVSWEPVTGLKTAIFCVNPDGQEMVHVTETPAPGVYRTLHPFTPGQTYAALRIAAVDDMPLPAGFLETGFWVNLAAR